MAGNNFVTTYKAQSFKNVCRANSAKKIDKSIEFDFGIICKTLKAS